MKKKTIVRWQLGVLGIVTLLLLGRLVVSSGVAEEVDNFFEHNAIIEIEEIGEAEADEAEVIRLNELAEIQAKMEEAEARAAERMAEAEATVQEAEAQIENAINELRAAQAAEMDNAQVPTPPTGMSELVNLTRVGNDADVSESLTLHEASTIHVYATGEISMRGRKYDYGWIENAEGDKVWEMERESTVPAGGHTTNRVFSGIVNLEAGNYTVRYVSDGTNSFEQFDTEAPMFPEHWGILIVK